MENFITLGTTAFFGLFAIMNPIGNTPVFLSLTNGYDNNIAQKIALKTIITTFLVTALFSMLGTYVFKIFHITLPAFQIAGGILVTGIGFNMVRHNKSKAHDANTEIDRSDYTDTSIAISPLAMPILAGPGTLTTVMNLTGINKSIPHTLIVLLALFINCLIIYLLFLSGKKLIKFIGQDITDVISKLMGLIIAVIGVQMVIAGCSDVLGNNIKLLIDK